MVLGGERTGAEKFNENLQTLGTERDERERRAGHLDLPHGQGKHGLDQKARSVPEAVPGES